MMPVHPFKRALDLPKPEGEDLEALLADVEEFGFRQPAIAWEGLLIDGEVRALLADILKARGRQPATPLRVEQWDGQGSLVLLILSLDLHRRHLDCGARAMIAAKAVDMVIEECKLRPEAAAELTAAAAKQEARLPAPPGQAPGPAPVSRQKWRAFVANLAQVSTNSVKRAAKIETEGSPELRQAVKEGKVSVRRAARIADLPGEQQVAELQRQHQQAKKEIVAGELTRAFGAAGKHHDQGARQVAAAVKALGRAVTSFQAARDAIAGYDARPLLERLRKDIAVGERLVERVEETAAAIAKEGKRLIKRSKAAA